MDCIYAQYRGKHYSYLEPDEEQFAGCCIDEEVQDEDHAEECDDYETEDDE